MRLALVLLLLPGLGSAQSSGTALYRYRYDVTSTSLIYGVMNAQAPFAGFTVPSGNNRCKTSGIATLIDEFTVGTNPFVPLAVGDIIRVTVPTTKAMVVDVIVAKASDASIQVSTGIDLTAGSTFTYMKRTEGTGLEVGWINVGSHPEKEWSWALVSMSATNVQVQIQCRDSYPGAPAVVVYPDNPLSFTDPCYTGIIVAGSTECSFKDTRPWAQCRMGQLVTGDTGTQIFTAGYTGR